MAKGSAASPLDRGLVNGDSDGRASMTRSTRTNAGTVQHPCAVESGSSAPLPNPSLQPTRYGWLRQPPRAAELKRYMSEIRMAVRRAINGISASGGHKPRGSKAALRGHVFRAVASDGISLRTSQFPRAFFHRCPCATRSRCQATHGQGAARWLALKVVRNALTYNTSFQPMPFSSLHSSPGPAELHRYASKTHGSTLS